MKFSPLLAFTFAIESNRLPLAIIGTYVGELVGAGRLSDLKFHEIDVRAQTGLGAEPVPAAG